MHASEPSREVRWTTALAAAASLYPVLVHVAVHAIWAEAWRQNGHRPHAGSGFSLGGFEMALLLPTYLALLASPLPLLMNGVLLLSIAAQEQLQTNPFRAGTFRGFVALAVVTWGCGLVLALADPLGAVDWFMD